MNAPLRDHQGMTLVEVLVAMVIFSIVSIGFYSVMLSGIRGATATESGVDVSAEARLGLNRLIRDVREATTLRIPAGATELGPDEFSIAVDFSRDGDTDDPGEVETFTYDPVADVIRLSTDLSDPLNGNTTDPGESEVLIEGVERVTPTSAVFRYSSNLLEFDSPPLDGIVTCLEVADPPPGRSGGDGPPCNAGELPFLTNVDFSFRVSSGSGATARGEAIFGQAQLRNLR